MSRYNTPLCETFECISVENSGKAIQTVQKNSREVSRPFSESTDNGRRTEGLPRINELIASQFKTMNTQIIFN